MTLKTAIASILLATTCITTTSAQAAIRHDIDIPAQELGSALVVLAKQARIQVVYSADLVQGHSIAGLNGSMTPDEALDKLLDKTNLAYEFLDEQTVTLSTFSSKGGESSRLAATRGGGRRSDEGLKGEGAKGKGFWNRLRLSQAESSSSAGGQAASDDSPRSSENRIELEEIVVTGSHIRGSQPAGSKITVIDREDIFNSGYGRLQDVLATVTQNFKGGSEEFNQRGLANNNYGAEIQLRGLGPGTTLTLVNGIRQPVAGSQGAFVDVSNIPVAAIERIEILPDGASAIYGSDAIGGVANILLRRDFEGSESRLRYATAGGQAEELQASQMMGISWGAGSALVGYQYLRREELAADSRDYTAANGDMRRYGGSDFREVQRLYQGAPGTILCPSGRTDCPANTPAFAIPMGQNGVGLTPSDLIRASANYADNVSGTTILPEQEMHSLFFSGSHQLNDVWSLGAIARFNRRDIYKESGPRRVTVTVPSTNPFYVNAFGNGAPLRLAYDLSQDLGPVTNNSDSEGYSIGLEAVARLTDQWQAKIVTSFGRERTISDLDFVDTANPATTAAMSAALADSDPATAFNVFGDGSYNNPETVERFRSINHFDGVSRIGSLGVTVDGPVFGLPGGAARLAIGSDYRNQGQRVFRNRSLPDQRDTYAAFGELSLPIARSNTTPGLNRLDASIAARYERYSDFGSSIDPKIGLTWLPVASVALRANWGTSFRAPPLYQSNVEFGGGATALATVVSDPLSPTGSSKVVFINGNNEKLKEETATAWNVGLDFSPESLPNARLSLTYFDIEYEDKIEANSVVLTQEDIFGSLITRNPSATQLAQICNNPSVRFVGGDCSGTIAAILDIRVQNVALVTTSGIDLAGGYSWPTGVGEVELDLGGTYTLQYERAVTPTAPVVDVVDTFENPLALRLRGGVSWTWQRWSSKISVFHTGSYRDPASIPERRIDSSTTVDLTVAYRIKDAHGWMNGTDVSVSAVNVTDELPPFVNRFNGYDGANSTILGRLISLQLVKSF